MKEITPPIENSFVYSCSSEEKWGYDQFVPDHILAFQVSGETHVFNQKGTFVLKKNRMLLAHRNQFAKSLKLPADDKEYKAVSVIFKTEDLKKYAALHSINIHKKYEGKLTAVIQPDVFLQSYFQSLIPYLENPEKSTNNMSFAKVSECIELLLNYDSGLRDFLFDFSEPHKINLAEFMQKNFHYNAPIENFARLTGRSLAAFKRDFVHIFNTSPAKWLKNKRLEEAHELIHKKNKKSADIYLDLGFENLSHFYTAFKQKYGVTPTESLTLQK